MFKKKDEKKITEEIQEPVDVDDANLSECCHDVHSEHVALPEVRTGEHDVDDDFAKTQDERNKKQKHRLSLEAVAIPEFHTGKVFAHDEKADASEDDASDEESEETDGKKHHLIGDLVHTLLSGTPE